jgi:uncharacterized membrane protein YhaH (DUF805 family)
VAITGMAWHDVDMSPTAQVSASAPTTGIKSGPFTAAVLLVYLLSFMSQMLLSPPVTSRLSVLPFVLTQGVLISLWIVLHRRRLRDAGRPSGTAIGVAMVYALEIVLLVIVVWIMRSGTTEGSDGAGGAAGILYLFVILYFLGQLTGDPNLGALQIWVMGFVVLMLLPVVIALGFSIWTGTRPSKPPASQTPAKTPAVS